MNKMIRSGTLGACTAVALAAYAATGLLTDFVRPDFRVSDIFLNKSPPADHVSLTGLAAAISSDGELLTNYAATKAADAFQRPSVDPKIRTEQYKTAERAAITALKISPIQPALWLALGTLRAQSSEPVAPALKMSYLTGSLPVEMAFFRIRTATSTSAASDEEIRLLALSDVRAVLANRSRFEAPLIATFAQATPPGRSLLLETAQAIDPNFNAVLRRY